MLAVMGEGPFLKRLEDNLHLLLKQIPVSGLVKEGCAKGLHLSGMIAAAYAESDATFSKDISGGIVFSQPQGMPHGADVEAAAKIYPLCEVGQVDAQHQNVGDALVAL